MTNVESGLEKDKFSKQKCEGKDLVDRAPCDLGFG